MRNYWIRGARWRYRSWVPLATFPIPDTLIPNSLFVCFYGAAAIALACTGSVPVAEVRAEVSVPELMV